MKSNSTSRAIVIVLWLVAAGCMLLFYTAANQQNIEDTNSGSVGVWVEWQELDGAFFLAPTDDAIQEQPDGTYLVTELFTETSDSVLQVGDRILLPIPFFSGPADFTVPLTVQRGDSTPIELDVPYQYPSEYVAKAILKALAKDPNDRFESAFAFAEALNIQNS